MLDSMFQYGMLWIFIEELEQVQTIIQENQLDDRLVGAAIARGYRMMYVLHAKVQALVQPFHLQLGYCKTTATIIIIDDEMDGIELISPA